MYLFKNIILIEKGPCNRYFFPFCNVAKAVSQFGRPKTDKSGACLKTPQNFRFAYGGPQSAREKKFDCGWNCPSGGLPTRLRLCQGYRDLERKKMSEDRLWSTNKSALSSGKKKRPGYYRAATVGRRFRGPWKELKKVWLYIYKRGTRQEADISWNHLFQSLVYTENITNHQQPWHSRYTFITFFITVFEVS